MSRAIDRSMRVKAPVDAVWRAITEADELIRWFPVEARVEPGLGGSVWLSWGPGVEGTAPITTWEPPHRFGWTETRGAVKLAVDFHLQAAEGTTVVRLVQSGFGDGAEWDDEFHMTEGGWSYFLAHLRFYLERHPGTRRDLISFREALSMTQAEAFLKLTGRSGLAMEDAMRPGERYETTTALGDRMSGIVVAFSPDTWQLGFTVEQLGDAIVFVEIEPAASGSRPGFWLSTYGLPPDRLADARARFERLYRDALELTVV